MASLYKKKKSPYWYLRFLRSDGSWGHSSLKLRTDIHSESRKARELCALATAREMATGNRKSGAALTQWVPDWITAHFNHGLTLVRVRNCWSSLSTYFEEKHISHPQQVTRELCMGYLAWRTKADRKSGRKARHHNTAILEMKYLAQILDEAVLRGLITQNPAAKLGIGRIPVKQKPALTNEQIAAIFAELEKQDGWMSECFLIALCQGVRLSETKVPMHDVHLGADNLIVFNNTKGNKPFGAMIHPDLRPLLERKKAEGAKFTCEVPRYASKLFSQIFHRLGIPTSFHSTRVTVVTRLALAGVDKRLAQLYVNHSSELVHDTYTRLRPEHAAPVVAALHYGGAYVALPPATPPSGPAALPGHAHS